MATKKKTFTTSVGGDNPKGYRDATEYLDCDHPAVVAFTNTHVGDAKDDIGKAVNLYYGVRDSLRYDPYLIRLHPETYRASYVVEQGAGFCIQKATVFTAACRRAGIPARPGYADVRNHLATGRLLELIGTDIFLYHGYVEVWLNDRWVKATPIFNLELCERFDVAPLEFDGQKDSLHQPYNAKGRKYMEYITDHGARHDVPVSEIIDVLLKAYPKFFRQVEDTYRDFYSDAGSPKDGRESEK